MRRLICMFVLCLAVFCFPSFALSVQPDSIVGTWTVTGTTTVKANINSLFHLKVTVLKNESINDTFVYDSDTLTTQKIGSLGTYTIGKRGKIRVDISPLLSALQTSILNETSGISDVSYSKQVFVMDLVNSNNFAGALNIIMNIDTTFNNQPVLMVLKIHMSLNGVRVYDAAPLTYQNKDAVSVISNFITKKAIAPILSRITGN